MYIYSSTYSSIYIAQLIRVLFWQHTLYNANRAVYIHTQRAVCVAKRDVYLDLFEGSFGSIQGSFGSIQVSFGYT